MFMIDDQCTCCKTVVHFLAKKKKYMYKLILPDSSPKTFLKDLNTWISYTISTKAKLSFHSGILLILINLCFTVEFNIGKISDEKFMEIILLENNQEYAPRHCL